MLATRDGSMLSEIEHGVFAPVSSYDLPPLRARILEKEDLVLLGYRAGMVAVDREGRLKWRLNGRTLSATPLAVVDGNVYAGAADTGTDSEPAVIEIPLHPELPY